MFRCLKRGPGFYGYLWRLTGPIALQNLITFSLGLIDTLMVSWLGNTQMAAVTTANVPVFLLISIVFGVQSGLGILVSQYWGKKDMESISRAIGVAAMLGTGITLVLAVVLFLWPVQIMDLLSNKHELSVLGAPYLKLIGFSYVFNMLSSIYVSAMRSAENAGFGMKLFGVSTLLNTGMNYILIFGKCGFPALGIQGAAIATPLSRVAEFLICLVCAMRSRILPLDLAAFFRPGWEMLRRFVKYSTPVILNETAWGLGNSLLTVILGYTDNSVEMLAANAVMGNLNRLFLVVCFGLGAATAVMVGKAIGEGQSHREVMDLSRTLLVFTLLVGTGAGGGVPGAGAHAVRAGGVPAVQADGPVRRHCRGAGGDVVCDDPPARLFHLRRHRRAAGRRRRGLVGGAGHCAPVAAGPAADGPAGPGVQGQLLVHRRRHSGGEPAEGAPVRPAHPHRKMDPRRHPAPGGAVTFIQSCHQIVTKFPAFVTGLKLNCGMRGGILDL